MEMKQLTSKYVCNKNIYLGCLFCQRLNGISLAYYNLPNLVCTFKAAKKAYLLLENIYTLDQQSFVCSSVCIACHLGNTKSQLEYICVETSLLKANNLNIHCY